MPEEGRPEPVFGHGPGGMREIVHPGNKEYVRGDRIERPKGGAGRGSGSGQASDSGEGEDDFVFRLTKEEFMQIFFDDLALPHLMRTQLAETPEMEEPPRRLHERRHAEQPARGALDARRDRPAHRASARDRARELRELEARLAELPRRPSMPREEIAKAELEEKIAAAARPARPHSLSRPDRPALPQPRSRAGARPPRR